MFLIVLMYTVFASVFAVGKYALNYSQPIFLIAFRMFLGGAFLIGYLFFTNKENLFIKRKDIYLFIPIVFVHVYLAYVTEFWALNYLTAAKTCLLYSLTPFLAAILSDNFATSGMIKTLQIVIKSMPSMAPVHCFQ